MTTKKAQGRVQAGPRALRKFRNLCEKFRQLDPEMQLQQLVTFLLVAENGEISMNDLRDQIGIAKSSMTRNVAALSKMAAPGKPGHNLVVATENPFNRREKLVTLTAKGKALANTIQEEIG